MAIASSRKSWASTSATWTSLEESPQRGILLVMMTTEELIDEALSLPVEERVRVTDSLLRSLNTPKDEIDRQWAEVAKRRLVELRSGQVRAIPGEEVMARMRERLAK